MSTVCPWPGVIACAVENSPLRMKTSLPAIGTQPGSVVRWCTST